MALDQYFKISDLDFDNLYLRSLEYVLKKINHGLKLLNNVDTFWEMHC
jgi:hypothetical protein